jgi:hypothetical protein
MLYYKYEKDKLCTIYRAIYKKQWKWYLGWIDEIPGVDTQSRILQEARENL